ncbi:MAG: nucleotidyltransferase [Desulfuromonas sp.]|nr:MAG: nucleotidyltransferase [Desulfuromonas sp.]
MKSVGLITEYNPFHNGHLFHLQQSLEVSEAEVSVAVMSGHFLQRGEPALLDKWLRSEMALRAGVDLVVELPLPWACNSAPEFARGGVQALSILGVDSLCFGSESGDLTRLQQCAGLLETYADRIDHETRDRLRQGENYPTARAAVVAELSDDPALTELLAQPNNILGLEYLRALNCQSSTITPFTITRQGAGYHSTEAADNIASATGIRTMLGDDEDVAPFVPATTATLLRQGIEGGMNVDSDILYRLLIQMLQQGGKRLAGIYQIGDGVENRLYKAAQTAEHIEGLIGLCKSKQFTRTRIQRILTYILLGIDGGLMKEFLDCGPLYLHLLGQSEKGEAFLAEQRKEFDIPLVGNYSRVRSILTHRYGRGSQRLRLAQEMLAWEIRATRTYTLLRKNWPGGNRNLDFFREVIRTG